MSFAQKSLLAALLLLVPVLLAFLVKRRRVVMQVPSTYLWRLAGLQRRRSSRLRNVTRLAALLATLGAVAALVVAAAGPKRVKEGGTTAVVIDTSASMDAGGRGSPLRQAKRFVSKMVAASSDGDRFVIIAAGSTPVRLAGPAPAGASLDEAIDRLKAERTSADMGAAVDLATSLIEGTYGAKIVILTDGGEGRGEPAQRRGVPVTQRVFLPPSRDNVGITAFAARPVAESGDEREALVVVATSSERARSALVTLLADGHEILRKRLEIPASSEAELRARVRVEATELVARVAPADGASDVLASDDEAKIAAPVRPPPRVLLFGAGDEGSTTSVFFVERALQAAGVREIVRATPDFSEPQIEAGDIVVALGEGPQKKLHAPALYIATRAGSLPYPGVKELSGGDTRLRSVESLSPLVRGVALEGVTIDRAFAIQAEGGARSLIDLDGGSVLVMGGAGKGSWVYLGVDPAKSDLALRVAFPVLVANAVSSLSGATEVASAETLPRAEVAMRAPSVLASAFEDEADVPLRFALPIPLLLGAIAVLLLAAEAWGFRKGYAT